jgi:hypothetical protein
MHEMESAVGERGWVDAGVDIDAEFYRRAGELSTICLLPSELHATFRKPPTGTRYSLPQYRVPVWHSARYQILTRWSGAR